MESRTEMDATGGTEGTNAGAVNWGEETTEERMRTLVEEVKDKAPEALALATFAGLTFGAAALGSVANRRSLGLWYKTLRKPPFQPPAWLFAPVWTALYGLIATSGYRVWKAPRSQERTRALALWGSQLALNSAWSPLFFGLRQKRLALADLVALLGTVAAYTETTRKVDKPAAAMMGPYLAWLAFAGVLNEEIIRRNRGWRRLFG
jgi:benzodiazapine receptor